MGKIRLSAEQTEMLRLGEDLELMVKTRGWQHYKGWLESKLNPRVNPLEFKDEKEYLYASRVRDVYIGVIAEVLEWVEKNIEASKHYQKMEKGEIPEPHI